MTLPCRGQKYSDNCDQPKEALISPAPTIYVVATLDTKGNEAAFVADVIGQAGVTARLVDVGVMADPQVAPHISRDDVAACHPAGAAAVLGLAERGPAVTAMGDALVAYLKREHAAGRVAGVIGMGGSGGTALIAPALRALPVGLPKVLVSTVASGNTAPYVGASDLILVPSVVDVAGLNSISRQILSNAANAVAGMVRHRPAQDRKTSVLGMTMFGVTTPCVSAVRQQLEQAGYDCLVFHATGTGGRAMEQLVENGVLTGVLDITTTEVADEVVGGVFPAGPARFDAILAAAIPYVMSLGALDMVNFGAIETVPPQFAGRKLHNHNAQVTLMRTTPEENRLFARWIAGKINRSTAPLMLLIPAGGVSALDAPGQPFHDPAADQALFDEIKASVQQTDRRQVRELPYHINDPKFAEALVAAFEEVRSMR
jgi:uncharacterized protein (UPF0261 family)